MDLPTVIQQLSAYARRNTGTKAQLAGVTAHWLGLRMEFGRVYTGMLDDPLIRDIVAEAALETACGWRPGASDVQTIYCDGCCLDNGRPGARAGFGVYITTSGGAQVLAESFRVPPADPQTNQRAELLALRYALSHVSEHPSTNFHIYTDSQYAIDCMEKWASGWEASGWRKSNNKPVLHADLIMDCLTARRRADTRVSLVHIAAHTGLTDVHSRGNAMADRLAKAGAEWGSATL
jgi:ribonuclease HI